MKSGIYKITNLITEKIYIGSSAYCPTRMARHRWDLKRNRHPNNYLQASFNLHGEEAFRYEIIEFVEDKSKLIEREQYWLDFTQCYEPHIGYNVLRVAGSTIGSKRTSETKAKMSAWQVGRIMSEEAKAKMSFAARDFKKWPCVEGEKCRCENCSGKVRKYKTEKMREYRYKQSVVSDYICGALS